MCFGAHCSLQAVVLGSERSPWQISSLVKLTGAGEAQQQQDRELEARHLVAR